MRIHCVNSKLKTSVRPYRAHTRSSPPPGSLSPATRGSSSSRRASSEERSTVVHIAANEPPDSNRRTRKAAKKAAEDAARALARREADEAAAEAAEAAVRGAYERRSTGGSGPIVSTRREPLRSRSLDRGSGEVGGGARAAGGERRTSTTVSHSRTGVGGGNDAISKPHKSTADMWAEVGQMDATGTRPERVPRQNRGQRGRGARPGSEGVSGPIDPAMLHILAHTGSVSGVSSSGGGSSRGGGLTGVSSSGGSSILSSGSGASTASSRGRGRDRGRGRASDNGGSSSFSSSHRSGSSASSSVSWGSSVSSSDYSTSSSASSRSGSSVSSGSTSSRGRSYARSNSSASSTRGSSLGFGGPLPSPVPEGSEGSGSSASSGGTGGFGDDDDHPRKSKTRRSRGFVKPVRVQKVVSKKPRPDKVAVEDSSGMDNVKSAWEAPVNMHPPAASVAAGGVEEPISPASRLFKSLQESVKRATEEGGTGASGDGEAKLRRAAEALKNAGINADGGGGGFSNRGGGGGGGVTGRRVLLERQDTGRGQWPVGPKHFSQGSSIFDSVASGELDQLEEQQQQRRRQQQEQQQQQQQAEVKDEELEEVASLDEGSSFSAELYSLGTTDAGSSPRSGGGSDWVPSDAGLLDSLGVRNPSAASVAGDHPPSAASAIAALEEEDSGGDVNEDNKVGSGDLAGGGTGRTRRHQRIGSSSGGSGPFSFDTQESGSTTPANDSSSSTASVRGDSSWSWQKSFGTVRMIRVPVSLPWCVFFFSLSSFFSRFAGGRAFARTAKIHRSHVFILSFRLGVRIACHASMLLFA